MWIESAAFPDLHWPKEDIRVHEMRDGLIARHTILYDGVTAMQQLGLMPADTSLLMKAQTLLQNADMAIRGMLKR